MFKPDKRLKNKYLRFRKLYWDNGLPADVEIGWDKEVNAPHEGKNQVCLGAFYKAEEDCPARIALNPEMKKWCTSVIDITLLHECCHLKVFPYAEHGQPWQEEMIRVAIRGGFAKLW